MRSSIVLAAALVLTGAAAPALAQGGECTTKSVMDAFIPLFYEQRDARKSFTDWVAEDYIQHNPVAKDGRDNAIAALEPFFKSMPTLRYTVARVIIEGDLAVPTFKGSGEITSLSQADGYVEIPIGVARLDAGADVEVVGYE